jgi:hypothetical protein
MASNEKVESRGRGFAGMDKDRQRQISSEGGKAAHQKGTAHEFGPEEAREAGRKGGMVSGAQRRARESGTPNPTTTEHEIENERESGSMTGGEGSNAPAGHGA